MASMKKIIVIILSFITFFKIHTEHTLVDVTKTNPNIILDIKYATKDNFTGEAVYSKAKCYLKKEVAQALNEAAKEFEALGYKFKIWDGYRPHKIQYKFWDIVKDKYENPKIYVMPPDKGSRHNRGCAIDLTLVDKNGKELQMGTGFDDFSKKAHRDYKKLPKKVLDNRKLFESIMKKHGFEGVLSEWWHYDYVGKDPKNKEWKNHPILDIPFEELEKN